MEKNSLIKGAISNSIEVKKRILEDKEMLALIEKVSEEIIKAVQSGNKILFCGNGGSAADAQHLSAEFSGRFYFDRDPIFAEALHTNTSHLTAVANDYSFAEVYSRLVKAMGKQGDILVGISTSGNSENIVQAIQTAKELNMIAVGLTGEKGGEMEGICDYVIKIPSCDTPRIQEAHILIGHIICEIVEKEIFSK